MRTMFLQPNDIPYALGGSFKRFFFRGAFGLVFSDCPGQGRNFAFQAACELVASIVPGVGKDSVLAEYLEVALGLAARSTG